MALSQAPLWNHRRIEFFDWFDGYASKWEVSVRDGTVIEGWLNQHLKEAIAKSEAMRKERAEMERLKPQTPILHQFVKKVCRNTDFNINSFTRIIYSTPCPLSKLTVRRPSSPPTAR